jgi:hypothetical protein
MVPGMVVHPYLRGRALPGQQKSISCWLDAVLHDFFTEKSFSDQPMVA